MDMITTPARIDDHGSLEANTGLSLLRLNMLRSLYLLLFVGLGLTVWPYVFHHSEAAVALSGVRLSLMAGLGLTAALGLLQPARMLPLLVFEVVWKAIYLTAFALPLWLSAHMNPTVTEDTYAILIVAIFPPLMPWRYIFRQYLRAAGAPWFR